MDCVSLAFEDHDREALFIANTHSANARADRRLCLLHVLFTTVYAINDQLARPYREPWSLLYLACTVVHAAVVFRLSSNPERYRRWRTAVLVGFQATMTFVGTVAMRQFARLQGPRPRQLFKLLIMGSGSLLNSWVVAVYPHTFTFYVLALPLHSLIHITYLTPAVCDALLIEGGPDTAAREQGLSDAWDIVGQLMASVLEGVSGPVLHLPGPLTPDFQCRSLVTFCQLVVGLMAPLYMLYSLERWRRMQFLVDQQQQQQQQQQLQQLHEQQHQQLLLEQQRQLPHRSLAPAAGARVSQELFLPWLLVLTLHAGIVVVLLATMWTLLTLALALPLPPPAGGRGGEL